MEPLILTKDSWPIRFHAFMKLKTPEEIAQLSRWNSDYSDTCQVWKTVFANLFLLTVFSLASLIIGIILIGTPIKGYILYFLGQPDSELYPAMIVMSVVYVAIFAIWMIVKHGDKVKAVAEKLDNKWPNFWDNFKVIGELYDSAKNKYCRPVQIKQE